MKNKKRFKIPIDMIPKTYLMTLSCALSSNSTIKSNLAFVEVESRSKYMFKQTIFTISVIKNT